MLMSFTPSEVLTTAWPNRNRLWIHYKHDVKRKTAGIPHRLWDVTVDDVRLDNKQGESVREWVESWPLRNRSGDWDDIERGQGLLLMGEPGRGKTTHAIAAANSISDKGWAAKYITVANWHEMALTSMRINDPEEAILWTDALGSYEMWAGWPLLVMDDLGKEHATASNYARDNLDRLSRNRYDSGAPSIYTTNLSLEEIGTKYGPSMGSFVKEAFTIVPYDSLPDYR
jgi:DNA replication protein DnaC